MLIPLSEVMNLGVHAGPTVHVGAHLGEEARAYDRFGFFPVYWVEANHEKIHQLRYNVEPLGGIVVPALVSDKPGPKTFHLASNGQSSSYYELGTHAIQHPDVVYVGERTLEATTLDALTAAGRIASEISFLCMDVQGAELDVLRGASGLLQTLQGAYLEVNTDDVYKGCAQEPEVTQFMAEHGFEKVFQKMTPHSWGDAVYVRIAA